MNKFYVADCPDRTTIHMWISESTGMDKFVNTMKPKNPQLLYEFADPLIDVNKLTASCETAFEKLGWYGFLNIYGTKFERNPVYGGLSLVYNPNYRYTNIPHNAQTLGYPRSNMPDELFVDNFEIYERIMELRLDKDVWSEAQEFGTHHAFRYLRDNGIIDQALCDKLISENPDRKDVGDRVNKNTYSDTWGFNKFADLAYHDYFAELTNRIKRNPIRSRLAQIKNVVNDDIVEKANTYLWHRDDSWFYELRINLSVTNPQNTCGIEIENYGAKTFVPGNWYVWDTYATHRPYVERPIPGEIRTNYVLAVNPWFDWVEEEQCWVKNEFFGEKHPVDMVIDGDVIEGLKLVE